MNYFWIFIISALSIALPVSATLARLQRLSKRYLPLAVLLWAGLLNEVTSYIMIMLHRNNMANSNIYTLVEFGLFLWLFYRLSKQKIVLFLVMGIIGSVAWAADNVVFHSIWHDNAVFRMLSSILVVYLSIDKINQVLFNGLKEAYRQTDLLLCFSFFVHYTYKAFLSTFNVFPMGLHSEFYTRLWLILGLINIATNLIYTIAILWIPKQQEYILRS